MALLNTQIATSTASFVWMLLDTTLRGQPSVLGMLSGAVSGLVAITPACGFVDPTGAFFIGFLAGPMCYYGARLKHSFGYDDALDAFGVRTLILNTIIAKRIDFFATGSCNWRCRGRDTPCFLCGRFGMISNKSIQICVISYFVAEWRSEWNILWWSRSTIGDTNVRNRYLWWMVSIRLLLSVEICRYAAGSSGHRPRRRGRA